MTATDRLRALLDDRGVEWDGETFAEVTFWNDDTNLAVASDGYDGRLWVSQSLTPEQAVEATLGRGTCHAVFEVDAMSEDERIGEYVCSECGETFGDGRDQQPNYCPNCGRRCVG